MKINVQKQKAISLISLVITIIILLILAGISIAVLTNSKLFDKSKQAKQEFENSQNVENGILDEYIKKIDEVVGNKGNSEDDNNFDYNKNLATIDFWGEKIYTPFQGEGTQSNPYKITNVSGLAFISMLVNSGESFQGKYIELSNDLNLNENKYNVNVDNNDVTFFTDAKQWIPIGSATNSFKGIFDGKNHIIKGLYINSDELSEQALFGVNEGIIKNVNLQEGYVKGTQDIATICAQNKKNGIVEKCYSAITVISSKVRAGGICSTNEGVIQECCNKSSIKAIQTYSGGICAYNLNEIKYCYNLGKVVAGQNSSGNSYAGGIVGYNLLPGVIQYTYNMGIIDKINGTNYLGGIVGQSNQGNLYDSYSCTLTKIIGRNYSAAGNTANVSIKSENEMCQESFIDLLGEKEYWKFDSNIQKVVLSWQ